MINEIMNTPEIKWLMKNAKVERPYEDEDYIEHSFNGELPYHMANKIKAVTKGKWNKKNSLREVVFCSEIDPGLEKSLTIKFGKTHKTNNNVTFFYTEERL